VSHVLRATCYVRRALTSDVRRALTCDVRWIVLIAFVAPACGDSPAKPGPIVQPPPVINNPAPVIGTITVQGTRANEPANFADVGETVAVTASVTDAETAADLLQHNWTATLGSFTGSGARVSWVAPAAAVTPANVTITLEVVERFGTNQENRVSRTATLALHDSLKEVGDMSVRFLTEFSKPQTNKDWRDVMRDFKASACPDPGEVDAERSDVERHYTNFVMHNYLVSTPSVTRNFGGTCPWASRKGDSCAAVPVMWDSTDMRSGVRGTTRGVDHISAAFSVADNRWYLCSSYLQPTTSLAHPFYAR
jgi:hypothetical protein